MSDLANKPYPRKCASEIGTTPSHQMPISRMHAAAACIAAWVLEEMAAAHMLACFFLILFVFQAAVGRDDLISESHGRRLLREHLVDSVKNSSSLAMAGKGIRMGLRRMDNWQSFFSLSSMSEGVLERILEQILYHDLLRVEVLASKLFKGDDPLSSYFDDDDESQLAAAVRGFRVPKNRGSEAPVLAPSSSSEFLQSPVMWGSGGIYYTDLKLGTPPKDFSLIMDTGSDLTWVRCDECSDCSQTFDRLQSSTYKLLPCSNTMCGNVRHADCTDESSRCQYGYGYGDGSTTQGDLSTDTVIMPSTRGSLEEFPGFVFGCGTLHKGSLLSEAGLLGLSPGALSFPSQIGSKYGSMFSYCLLPQNDENAKKKSALIFGAEAELKEDSNVQFTPIVDNSTYFAVALEGISVGGELLDLPESAFSTGSRRNTQPTIFDSGTTLTMLPVAVYRSLMESFSSSISVDEFISVKGLDTCFQASSQSSFPTITFHFKDGADYETPSRNYLIDLGSSVRCLAFVPSDRVSIIGNIQQQDFHILHDLGNQRIGFKATDCEAFSME